LGTGMDQINWNRSILAGYPLQSFAKTENSGSVPGKRKLRKSLPAIWEKGFPAEYQERRQMGEAIVITFGDQPNLENHIVCRKEKVRKTRRTNLERKKVANINKRGPIHYDSAASIGQKGEKEGETKFNSAKSTYGKKREEKKRSLAYFWIGDRSEGINFNQGKHDQELGGGQKG